MRVASDQDERFQRWGDHLLTREERRALEIAGYGVAPAPLMRPALLVVDVTVGFCGDDPDASLEAAVTRHPLASGRIAWQTVPAIAGLVAGARSHGVPIAFTQPSPPAQRPHPDRGGTSWGWASQNRRYGEAMDLGGEILTETGITADDLRLEKEAPSAFHGTPLLRWLIGWGCDGVVVCGGTTSGCVRATAVDAFSHGFGVEVAADASFDRIRLSHDTSLFDIDLKYGRVRPVVEILDDWSALGDGGRAERSTTRWEPEGRAPTGNPERKQRTRGCGEKEQA